jgi:hypothetical protein
VRIAIGTSSLFPLFVFTSYTYPLYQTLSEMWSEGAEIIVHSDSIQEANQISVITKPEEILECMQHFHSDSRLSFIRSVLEYFPGNNYGNNSSRAVALFVLDVLDSIPNELPYGRFKEILKINLISKLDTIRKSLHPRDRKILADPKLVQCYWYPRVEISHFVPIEITVRDDQMPLESTKNRDRDIFHYRLALEDGDIGKMIVCDQNFAKQMPKEIINRLPILALRPANLRQSIGG